MDERKPLTIIDYVDDPNHKAPESPPPLLESFGYGLDTVQKARQWLTNPQNWFKSNLFIIKWDGLLPRICEQHGQRLINEPWDDGLAHTVMVEQRKRRTKKDRGETLDEKEKVQEDE